LQRRLLTAFLNPKFISPKCLRNRISNGTPHDCFRETFGAMRSLTKMVVRRLFAKDLAADW